MLILVLLMEHKKLLNFMKEIPGKLYESNREIFFLLQIALLKEYLLILKKKSLLEVI